MKWGKIAGLVIVIFTASICLASDDHVFICKEHEFSMQYPDTWSVGESIHPQTVIRVESPDGDDYNITVVKDPALTKFTTEQYAKEMLTRIDTLVNVMSQSYPDAKLVKKGTTQLSQQPAVYYIVDYYLFAAGKDISVRSLAISTKHKDKQYTLTFRTPQKFFDSYYPTIQRLALGFQLTKLKLDINKQE